jgi:hypothetical protein
MTELLEILKYTLPALIVFLTAWIVLKTMYRNEDKKRRVELSLSHKDTVLPLRLQAYERLILLLERISPEALVMRSNRQNITCSILQNELINAVRTEFEHNLAQQTYISSQAWEMVKSARNNVIKLINESAGEFKPDASGINLSKRILESAMELSIPVTYAATEYLKKEVRDLF